MRRLLIEMGIVLQVMLLISCNEWLDVKPSSQMEREDMYETEEGFKTALAGCYIGMKNNQLYGQALTMTTVEYLAQHWTTKAEDLENFMNFDWKADYSKGQASSIWSNMYTVINQLNDLLGQMEEKGERVLPKKELRNLIHGETLALRAFCHFDILRLFGPSPVASDKNATSLPYSEESGKEFRTYYNYDDYCAKIWADLKAAEQLLAEVDPVLVATFEELNEPKKMQDSKVIIDDFQAYRRVRFNYWALKALEARVALYLGDKSSAYAYAMEVIDARVKEKRVGDISLFGADMTNEFYTLPSETLFALNVYDLNDKIQSIFRNAQTCLYKWENKEKEVLTELFDGQTSDKRYDLWVPMDYNDQRQVSLKKYWQGEDEEDDDAIVYSQQIPLLRVAEMYLIAVETASTLTEKNEKLDQFRKSRGLPQKMYETEAEVTEELLREYQREFYAEGQMFFYYKRTGAKVMRWKDDDVELKDYQAPIPDTEYTL